MSIHDRATAALVTHLLMTADGALFGLGFAYVAYRSIRKYVTMSSALRKIQQAPSVQPSDLRSILCDENDTKKILQDDANASNSGSEGGDLVIVRGTVELKSAVEKGNWKSLKGSDLVVSQESGERGVILKRTQTCIYNQWRGVFGWTSDLRTILSRTCKEQEASSIKTVPFILMEEGKWSQSDYVVVNMEGCCHPLPLTTVYQHLQPLHATPFTFLQALFGIDYPVGMLYEEKILPLGKDISALGILQFKNGIPEIKASKDLPYFLSEMTKDQMLMDLSFRSKVLMWGGVVLGTIAIGIIGYSISRNWNRWKEWRRQRQLRGQQQNIIDNQTPAEAAAEEESGEVQEGELCVICLMRRRRSAFIPCGHLVCCQQCALLVERESSPKCPVCRQTIRNSVRIYDS